MLEKPDVQWHLLQRRISFKHFLWRHPWNLLKISWLVIIKTATIIKVIVVCNEIVMIYSFLLLLSVRQFTMILVGAWLASGQSLGPESFVLSTGKCDRLILRADGNIVVYQTYFEFINWSSNTANSGGNLLTLRANGSLVLTDKNMNEVWKLQVGASGT